MFHNFGAILVISPPYSFYVLATNLLICILSLMLSVMICKIRSADLQTRSQNLVGTALILFIISEVALVITTVIMFLLSAIILGPLTAVLNEFGGASSIVLVSYYVIYGLIYANLQFPSAFIFKKAVGDQFAGVFICFITINAGIWAIANMIIGLLGFPF